MGNFLPCKKPQEHTQDTIDSNECNQVEGYSQGR